MKIIFDTNVLVSAFMTGGNCCDVIDHSIDGHRLYYTNFIIDEFKKVFKDNFHYPETVIYQFIRFINKFFIEGDSAPAVDNVCRDPKDNQLIADAVINNIEVIITGDKDLLDLKTCKGVKIISPKEYWKL